MSEAEIDGALSWLEWIAKGSKDPCVLTNARTVADLIRRLSTRPAAVPSDMDILRAVSPLGHPHKIDYATEQERDIIVRIRALFAAPAAPEITAEMRTAVVEYLGESQPSQYTEGLILTVLSALAAPSASPQGEEKR